jgi:hypothetical protein
LYVPSVHVSMMNVPVRHSARKSRYSRNDAKTWPLQTVGRSRRTPARRVRPHRGIPPQGPTILWKSTRTFPCPSALNVIPRNEAAQRYLPPQRPTQPTRRGRVAPRMNIGHPVGTDRVPATTSTTTFAGEGQRPLTPCPTIPPCCHSEPARNLPNAPTTHSSRITATASLSFRRRRNLSQPTDCHITSPPHILPLTVIPTQEESPAAGGTGVAPIPASPGDTSFLGMAIGEGVVVLDEWVVGASTPPRNKGLPNPPVSQSRHASPASMSFRGTRTLSRPTGSPITQASSYNPTPTGCLTNVASVPAFDAFAVMRAPGIPS